MSEGKRKRAAGFHASRMTCVYVGAVGMQGFIFPACSGWREAWVMRLMLFDVKRWAFGGCWQGVGQGGVRQSNGAGTAAHGAHCARPFQPLHTDSQLRSSDAPFPFTHLASNPPISPWPCLTKGSCADCTALGVESCISLGASEVWQRRMSYFYPLWEISRTSTEQVSGPSFK